MSERRWCVISPELTWVDRILDDGTGPIEIYHDTVEVIAPSRRKAIVVGLQLFRKGKGECQNTSNPWWTDGNPFAGMKAQLIEPCLTHEYRFEECGPPCWPDEPEAVEAVGAEFVDP